ncbi:MAG: hypothetical protein JXB25_05660 [Deltaproteobacteria bacterium]|nr:hypothetical protein [Deltaproteobacteria bacterium]
MKRLIEVLTVVMVVALSSNAFAVLDANTNEGAGTAGESIRLTDGNREMVLNFSPNVNFIYHSDTADDDGNKQWYSASTYHAGGTNFYASSSDSTAIYKQSREANNVFADVTLPTSRTMTHEEAVENPGEGEPATVTVTQTAEQYWLANDWSK